jgi:hypothetical protein
MGLGVCQNMEVDAASLVAARKTGAEKFRDGDRKLNAELLSFWQWNPEPSLGPRQSIF